MLQKKEKAVCNGWVGERSTLPASDNNNNGNNNVNNAYNEWNKTTTTLLMHNELEVKSGHAANQKTWPI